MLRYSRLALVPTAIAGLLLATPADAQTRRMMVVEDDGAVPQILHFSGPDMRALREPDFVRDDLPVFEKRLALDDVQKPLVGTRIEAYLESFMELVRTTLPPQELMSLRHMLGDDDHAPGEVGNAAQDDAMGGAGDVLLHALEGEIGTIGLEGEEGASVMIAVTAGGPGGAWAPGGPGEFSGGIDVDVEAGTGDTGADVMIAFDGAEGVELTDEQIRKLEEHAQKLADRLQKRMDEGALDGPGGMHMALPMGIEERQAHFDRMREMAEEMEAGKKLLRMEFIADVQATLRPEQLERWPSLDRALTRKKTLPKGRLDGERTDLVAITEDLELTDTGNGTLGEQLEAYELTLHDALTRRNAYLVEAEPRIDEAVGEGNPEAALSVVDRATQMRIAVRSVNDQFTDVLASTLEPASAEAFRDQVRRTSYPGVYRQTPGLKIFEHARQLESLDERTLVNILELERSYRTDLEQANTRLVEAIRRQQPLEPRRGIEAMQAAMNGEIIELGGENDPIAEARKARRTLEERSVTQLQALLTPEQVAQLPPMPKVRRGPIMIERSTAQ